MREERTEREQWAETEARQFEKNADAIAASAKAWLERGTGYPDNCRMAYECGVKADGWRHAAAALRRPYYARLEYEQRQQD